MRFRDRVDAGRRLAEVLRPFAGPKTTILALPRGGVPVGFEVARVLEAPLDVILVRKLGVPYQPELAMGAIGEDGVRVLDESLVQAAGVTPDELARVEAAERAELERRALMFRGDQPRLDLTGRVAVIVDDGIATGATAKAACRVAAEHGAERIVLAAPAAARASLPHLARDADDLVMLTTPEPFFAVGQFYEHFDQTTDDEVASLLAKARRMVAAVSADPPDDPPDGPTGAAPGGRTARISSSEFTLEASPPLDGHLDVPPDPFGVVVFAHGSGSSRHSPRNRFVASVLNEAGIATVLVDLLTPDEERDRANVFDIELLAHRLIEVSEWVRDQDAVADLPLGYFGASTGAGAALWAASEPGSRAAAIVSRGGRPDLAGPRLRWVTAPTLLIVGGLDQTVLDLNRHAATELRCEKRIVVVPGATHLFEERGTLDSAAEAARSWFTHHLPVAAATPSAGGSIRAEGS